VGLLTSERESGPLSVKEAVASGMGTVAVDLPATRGLAELFPELIRIVDPSPEAVARGLAEMLERPPLPIETIEECRERFRSLGWDRPGHLQSILATYGLTPR
jgi:glycosyltransferase involved in cell wall biosynthesis